MNTKMNKNVTVVKNRAPAPIQISAEQIVREAADRQIESAQFVEPIIKIHDVEEYQQHLADRRSLYEKNIRYRREHIGTWIKYAKFEEENKEYIRARSIYERALEVEYRNATLWLRYIEFELRIENINHARNVLDRAIQLLPRVDFLWYKYIWIEEYCHEYTKCRTIYERWILWEPNDTVWISYAQYELRQKNHTAAISILQRYVQRYPTCTAYIKYAKFVEFELQNIILARSIYETAITTMDPDELLHHGAKLFIQFTKMEERAQEYDRVRIIYQYAIQLLQLNTNNNNNDDSIIDNDTEEEQQYNKYRMELVQNYYTFEKKYGNKDMIEQTIIIDHSQQYENMIQKNIYDYDTYIEYALMLQEYYQQLYSKNTNSISSSSTKNKNHSTTQQEQQQIQLQKQIRDIYERGIQQVPPTKLVLFENKNNKVKDDYRRYIYIWIYYAIYEEMICHNKDRAIEIYNQCLFSKRTITTTSTTTSTKKKNSTMTTTTIIPHEYFTFTKIWILLGQLYIRNYNINGMRQLFGKAIGIYTKYKHLHTKIHKIYTTYIQLEYSFGEIQRCRILYNKFIQLCGTKQVQVWIQYTNFEATLGEIDRCRAIYELAIQQQYDTHSIQLDQPEILWKSYIDYEINDTGDSTKVRSLYERFIQLLQSQQNDQQQKQQHVQAYISYAQFECTSVLGDGIVKARDILQNAYNYYKSLTKQALEKLNTNNSTGTSIITTTTLVGKEERVMILDAWRILEKKYGANTNDTTTTNNTTVNDMLDMIERKMPRRIKRKRLVRTNDTSNNNNNEYYEEYFDYQFPDDDDDELNNSNNNNNQSSSTFKMLEMAAKWKAEQEEKKKKIINTKKRKNNSDDEDDSDNDDDDSDSD